MTNTLRKKLLKTGCEICGFNRYLESCHIVPKRIGGGEKEENKIVLCPNHHKLLDYGLLNYNELKVIEHKLFPILETYKDNMKAQEYIYFLLGEKELAPNWLARTRNQTLKELGVDNTMDKLVDKEVVFPSF